MQRYVYLPNYPLNMVQVSYYTNPWYIARNLCRPLDSIVDHLHFREPITSKNDLLLGLQLTPWMTSNTRGKIFALPCGNNIQSRLSQIPQSEVNPIKMQIGTFSGFRLLSFNLMKISLYIFFYISREMRKCAGSR